MTKIKLILSFFFIVTVTTTQLFVTAEPRRPAKKMSTNETEEETMFKILVTHPQVPQSGLDLLKRSCQVIICQSVPPKRSEILEKGRGVHALYWASHEPLNAEVLNAVGPQLKSISTMSAGFDFVDVAELRRRKIPLGHTPTVLNNAVADIAIGLMIAAARRLKEGRDKIENSDWKTSHLNWMLGQDIVSSTVGFFGFGNIGQTIANRLKGFDIERIVYNTRTRVSNEIEQDFNAAHVSFNELLALSDILFIVAPLSAETAGVFNATAFGKMKKNAVLVNVARGDLVIQDDLYKALHSNQIFAAGLDVMTPEPLPADHPLMSLPNCVLSPHIGSATTRTRNDMAVIAAHNVLRGLAGEPMFAPAYK